MSAGSPSRKRSSPSSKPTFERAAGDQLELRRVEARRTPARRADQPSSVSIVASSSVARIAASSSVTSMPTGHQVMQRPQPTQPERAELVVPGAELVREPLAVARAAGDGRIAAAVDVRVVDREARVPDARAARRAVRRGRLSSSTLVQKQVGQTSVQLPQVRQRSATSSQRWMLEVAREQVADVGRVERAGPSSRLRPARRRHRRPRGRSAGAAPARERPRAPRAPRSLPASTRKRCSPSRISVSARS